MKYHAAPESLYDLLPRLKAQYFPHLANAKFLLLSHPVKMMRKGALLLAKIVKPSELNRFLSQNEAPADGYDYIIIFDAKLLEHCEEADIERVLRHELRHTFFDPDSKTPYKLVDHDFQDFYAEVELNRDDPRWCQRLARTVSLIHEQEKDQ
ncbi:MAG: putative metallopeptidase [Candidatus Cryosericum sp.]